jgi:hypothetical protein
MSLVKKVESYRKKMSKESFARFNRMVSSSVNLWATNTPNLKNKDLAELQIEQLAKTFTKKKSVDEMTDNEIHRAFDES